MPDSYNASQGKARAHVFRPSFLTVLLYLLGSALLLLVLNIRVVWSVILNSTSGPVNQADLGPLTDNVVRFLGKLDTPVLVLVWALFGAIVYGIIWVGQNTIFTVGTEVEESRYLKDGVVPQRGYWHKIMLSNFSFVGSVVLLIAYAIIFISFILPMSSKLFFVAFYEPQTYKRVLDICSAIIVTAASLYLFWVIQKIVSYTHAAAKA